VRLKNVHQEARTVVDESGHVQLLEVDRDIHDIREDMIATAGVAIREQHPVTGRVNWKEVNPLRCLFPDSGAVVNEMTYEVAKKLGLYKKPMSMEGMVRIQATGHSYQCVPTEVLLSVSPEDIRHMTDEELPDNLEPVTRKIRVYYPIKDYHHETDWDVLLGTEGAIAFNIVLRFAK
jgi:hypothetical protein